MSFSAADIRTFPRSLNCLSLSPQRRHLWIFQPPLPVLRSVRQLRLRQRLLQPQHELLPAQLQRSGNWNLFKTLTCSGTELFPFPPSGPDIPFVAVYKTQRDAESETKDRESECISKTAFPSMTLCCSGGDVLGFQWHCRTTTCAVGRSPVITLLLTMMSSLNYARPNSHISIQSFDRYIGLCFH